MNERTILNKTSVVIENLAKGKEYIFSICLGNKVGKGPCGEATITTPTTGTLSLKIIYIMLTICPLIFFSSFHTSCTDRNNK